MSEIHKATVLTPTDLLNLVEIQRLLDEGLEHYLTYESHCKSSEGYVSVSLSNSWERREGKHPIGVEVYSYVLGPERSHYFESTEEALTEVRKWHEREMAFVPPDDYDEQMNEVAKEFIEAMGDRLQVHVIGKDSSSDPEEEHSWSLGEDFDCETCGFTYNEVSLELWDEEAGIWALNMRVGCYGGESVMSNHPEWEKKSADIVEQATLYSGFSEDNAKELRERLALIKGQNE
jgi:hypothetical protein